MPSREKAAEAAPREARREAIVTAVLDAGVTFWRDECGEPFATVPRGGRIERYPVRSRPFRNLVLLLHGDAHPVTPRRGGTPRPGTAPQQALAEAMLAFEALALRSEVRQARSRLCRGADGAVWLDLGAPDWRLVRVDADGWRVVVAADVPLIRTSGLQALPEPWRSPGALDALRALLNVQSDQDFRLVVAWLVAALRPEGPFPVLAADGEQGSAKSTFCRTLRRLVDPNLADIRALPGDERNLRIAASNGRVVAFDNLSRLSPETADALCRVATGGGFGEREYYSNSGEVVVRICNPVLLNGIPSLLARPDLADRALAVTLPPIPDAARRTEAEMDEAFAAAAPGILALLLDGVALALRDAPGLRLPRLPRMADFAKLACAATPAFGWTAADMLAALEENRANAVALVIEADPVAAAVQALAAERRRWEGTATELLEEVNRRTPAERQRERDWPRDATRFSTRLRRVAPALRRAGVEVAQSRTDAARWVSVAAADRLAASSASSASSPLPGRPDDMTLHDADDAAAPPPGATGPYEGEL
jgi:Mg-chelatase subunit ChlI